MSIRKRNRYPIYKMICWNGKKNSRRHWFCMPKCWIPSTKLSNCISLIDVVHFLQSTKIALPLCDLLIVTPTIFYFSVCIPTRNSKIAGDREKLLVSVWQDVLIFQCKGKLLICLHSKFKKIARQQFTENLLPKGKKIVYLIRATLYCTFENVSIKNSNQMAARMKSHRNLFDILSLWYVFGLLVIM